MKAIMPDFAVNSSEPLYMQLYRYIKDGIVRGEIASGEKLPSLRGLADSLGLSVTTVELAYAQLSVEGYICSRPQRGYFVNAIGPVAGRAEDVIAATSDFDISRLEKSRFRYDTECYDFKGWKRCAGKVFSSYSHLLMEPSDIQGEEFLRHQIAGYLYTSRGVRCAPHQVVLAAGMQQITDRISTMLSRIDIRDIAIEEPGYSPVNSIFRDRGFRLKGVPVLEDGISIDELPEGKPSAVYVNPSSQFPTGAVMPAAKRYRLLKWAEKNGSYIIEDDYNSELRYLGRPVPSLQGLDTDNRVIYLGSFSGTLFPAIRMSYMVLPEPVLEVFMESCEDYLQTCSKAEQLALAIYMAEGRYQAGIRKMRKSFALKLEAAKNAFAEYGGENVKTVDTTSGMKMIIHVKSGRSYEKLIKEAEEVGLEVKDLSDYSHSDRAGMPGMKTLVFSYSIVPYDEMDELVRRLMEKWFRNG